MIKAILFDFDGVILDSMDVKTQAFYDMYLPYGKDIAERVRKHHLDNGGISRFEKFKLYHEEWLGIPTDESKIYELANEFSNRVFQGVINAPEVAGIRTFLDKAINKYRMWVITGTPTSEIREIVKAKKLDKYFVSCLGSPEKKTYWTAKIIQKEGLNPNEVVFIGDALADFEAASTNHIHFVLREHSENKKLFSDKKLPVIHNFNDFDKVIQSFETG